MRIGVLTSLYPAPPRPYEGIFAERRWRGMLERGHEVAVVHPLPRTPGPLARGAWAEIRDMPARETRHGITVERPRYWHWPGRALGNAARFARAGLRTLGDGSRRPDVVVADYAWPAACASQTLRERALPFVVSGRGSDVLQVAAIAELRAVLAQCLQSSAGWVGVSQDLVEAMDELAGRPGTGRLVPNGVDLERFVPGDQAAARERLGLAAGESLTLVVGHLIERKDPLLALEAFARAQPGSGRLVFLGRGPLGEAVRTAAAARGLSDRVDVRGEVQPEDLAGWYQACDCLLLTSSREGRPNVVLEALASGRPVVATDAGGTRELLADLPGSLVPERDPEAIAERLRETLAAAWEPEHLRGLVAHLSWSRSCETLERYLEERSAA